MPTKVDGKSIIHREAGINRPGKSRAVGRRALDALGPHVKAVQRLAEAAATRQQAENAVAAAREQAAEMIRRARVHATELLRAAEVERRDARVTYRDVFAASLTAGWTTEQLNGLGFDRVLLRPRRARRPNSGDDPTGGES